jgi:hypothetical protein
MNGWDCPDEVDVESIETDCGSLRDNFVDGAVGILIQPKLQARSDKEICKLLSVMVHQSH